MTDGPPTKELFLLKITLNQTSRVRGTFNQRDKYKNHLVSLVFTRLPICLLMLKSLLSKIYHFWSPSSKSVVSLSKPLRSLVYPENTLIAGRCILIEQPCVCLGSYLVKSGWILFLLLVFLIYPGKR